MLLQLLSKQPRELAAAASASAQLACAQHACASCAAWYCPTHGSPLLFFAFLGLLLRVSLVENGEVFKICLECWNSIVEDLYSSLRFTSFEDPYYGAQQRVKNSSVPLSEQPPSPRLLAYKNVLHQLREVSQSVSLCLFSSLAHIRTSSSILNRF